MISAYPKGFIRNITLVPGHIARPHLQFVSLQLHGGLGVVVVSPDELQLQPLHHRPHDDVVELEVGVVCGKDLSTILELNLEVGVVPGPGGGQLLLAVTQELHGGVQSVPVSDKLGERLLVLVQQGLLLLNNTRW